MHVAQVDGGDLTRVLRQMLKVPGRRTGCAFWRFTDKLIVEWSGMQETLPAHVATPVPEGLVVSCRFMKHAGRRHTYSGEVAIRWMDGHMHIDNHRVPAERAAGPRVFDLPFDASLAHVLRATLAHSAEEVRQSGYAVESEEITEKWFKSIRRAEKSLSWAGLDRSRLYDVLTAAILADKHR
jgi:hypothetical protein